MKQPGRPPKQLEIRTPQQASNVTAMVLSPVETKVAWDKEAGIFSRMGHATKRGVTAAGGKVKGWGEGVKQWAAKFKKPPPPPQVGRLRAGLGGAAIGAAGLGAVGAMNAQPGDRLDALKRNAVLGAGLGGAAGLGARGMINDVLAQRHAAKLLKTARDRTHRALREYS